jgi:hypothetical protein
VSQPQQPQQLTLVPHDELINRFLEVTHKFVVEPDKSGNIIVSGRWDPAAHQIVPLTPHEREAAQEMGLVTTTPMEL